MDIETMKKSKAAQEPTEGTFIRAYDGAEVKHPVNGVQKSLRIQQVVSWLLDGLTYMQVVDKCVAKWEIGERQAKRYIADARDQVEAQSAAEIRSANTLALYRLTELYHKALEAEDFKAALDVVKTTNRMLGLNAPDRIEAKAVTDWNAMSVAEQLDHVGTILARAEKANGEQRETN
jgi:hypothetical protein